MIRARDDEEVATAGVGAEGRGDGVRGGEDGERGRGPALGSGTMSSFAASCSTVRHQ